MTTSPTPAPSQPLLARLRRLLRGGTNEGRLRPSVDALRALALVQDGASLVDVRERHEWKSGHATRAVHIPLGQIEQGSRRLPPGGRVVVICASGMRSRTAAHRLRALGFDATSVSGGMGAWQRAGGEIRR